MPYTLEDICLTWNDYPGYVFTKALVGPENTFVFKFTKCYDMEYVKCYSSSFWDIYTVGARGIKQAAGLIFVAKGARVLWTEKAISSANEGNSYGYIESVEKTNPWSFNGIDLIKYEEAAEVITDLCTIMGVDVTIDAV